MKKDILENASRSLHKVGFKLKKHSPEILVVAGVAGVVTSAVMACKATTKADDILDGAKKELDIIHQVSEMEDVNYTEQDLKKDMVIVYSQTALKFVKLYGPSVVLGVLSISAIFASNNILKKRNMALAAAYATVDKGFKEYRSRVIERFGEELDKELKYNIKAQEVTETIVDENGETKEVTETINVANPNEISDFARFFDESCAGWTKDPEYNLMFLKNQQAYANQKLKAQGYLFLNEVYEALGIQKTKAGQCVGWVYDEKEPVGDNFVDFGIYNVNDERKRSFVNGYERSILLDFNVDGNILDMF